MLRTNPGGGGAAESTEAPRYRTWFEGYGISANNGPLGLFVGRQEDLGRGRRNRRARRPASISVSRSTRAAPTSTCRWRCSRRRST
jgi:hypothetical protein